MEPRSFPPTPVETACITLDLENNWDFEDPDLQYLVFDYIDDFIQLVRELDVPLSVFVVGQTLEERPVAVRKIDAELDVEFHLHSYHHHMSGESDIESEIALGVKAFETVLGHRPTGYRAPRFIMNRKKIEAVSEHGFEFDSSICPSYRPGVYNNLGLPNRPYYPDAAPTLLEIPVSVFPWLSIPLQQSYLRLLGQPLYDVLKAFPLPDFLVFNFHLHDIFHTEAHDRLGPLRRIAFNRNIDTSRTVLRDFVGSLRDRGYQFRKLGEVARETKASNSPTG